MALKDMDEKGQLRDLTNLEYRRKFDRTWSQFSLEVQRAITDEINRRLDDLIVNGKGITNISIEGGKVNPLTGVPGEWEGTPFYAIYKHFRDVKQSAMFFGRIWKLQIIERPEEWIGMRNDPVNRPTFKNRGISLDGKTYFLARE